MLNIQRLPRRQKNESSLKFLMELNPTRNQSLQILPRKKKKQKQVSQKKPIEKKNSSKTNGVRKVTKAVPIGERGVGYRGEEGLPAISQAMAGRTEVKSDKKKKVDLSGFHRHFNKEHKRTTPSNIALQFGLLYRDTEYALEGCINDLKNVHKEFLHQNGFHHDNTILVTDDTKVTPTKRTMESSLKQFVSNAINGDRLFLQYSGHGTSVKDKSRDEDDGFDEAICPLDGGVIIDDWMYFNVVRALERTPGASLFVLIDACHSGTCLDLQHQYFAERQPKPSVRVNENKNVKRSTIARVIAFSAALDNQTATDIQDSVPQGAFTEMFLQVFKKHLTKPLTYRQFLLNVDGLLTKSGYAQQASFSSTVKIKLDTECRFWT